MRRTPHSFALFTIVLGVLTLMFAPGGEAANAQDDLVPVPVIIEATSEAPDPQPVEPTATVESTVIAPEETGTVEVPTEEAIPSATPTSEGEIGVPPAPTEEVETPAPPTPTPLPTEGIIFYDDFEGDGGLSKWIASQGVLTVLDGTGNRVASLPGGGTLQPFNFPSLSAFELAVWFSPAASGGLTVQFAGGYTLTLASDAPAALVGADGTTLATGETVLEADTWRVAELLVQDDGIALAIDGEQQFAFTAEAAHTADQIILSGSGDGASVDDVSIGIPEEEEIEPSPTPSVTPTPGEPVSLEMERTKLDGVLLNVLDLYATGDSGSAFGMANSYMLQLDRQSRISVTIWAAEGYSGQQVANQIQKVEGRVEVTEAKFVRARVTLEGLAALSLKPQVSVILAAERLASTDAPVQNAALNIATRLDGITATIGDEGTEGFNILGAQAWHQAGFTGDIVGTPIRIGVIDIGFGGAENVGNNPDLTCLNSYPNVSLVTGGSVQAGDSRRGRDMAEVICDVAPNSKVRLYKVSNTSQLASAIDSASKNNRVIVIGVDLGVNASPGDGTLGRTDVALDPYAKIIEARQDGVIVIASAGNNGNGSVAFNYSGGNTTVQIKVAPGEVVNVGWNDWDANQNGGGPREDITMAISGAGIPTTNKPGRGSSNPGHQFSIPTGCTTDGQGLCTANLALTGLTGAASLVQVQATGLKSDIVSVTGGTFTLLNDAGNIARPGDSPDAITVGAVCADSNQNFPRLTYSSRGPVYSPGGNFTALPTAPFKGTQVKPDVVAPSQVSVRGGAVNNTQDWCTDVTVGFGGSEAAAAHVAGMAALLLNNEELTQFIGSGAQQAMKNYMRTHSADLHTGATPDGYDMVYGAGLVSLGSPTFNANTLPSSSTFITPNRLPTGQTCNSYLYVGPYDVGSINMDGTAIHPFTHPSYAIQAASLVANTCVVLLPGEYVTPWHITGLANPVKVYGYSSVVRVTAPSSRIHVQNAYVGVVDVFSKYGGIYIEDTNGVVINGFTFTTGLVTGSATNNFNYPQVFIADNANGARFSNNRIQNVFSTTTLIEVVNGSNNVHINGNVFRENNSDESLFGALLISVEDSGNAGNPVQVYENTFRDNTSIQGTWIINGIPPTIDSVVRWVPLVKSLDSYIDITNNVFRNNSSETLIQIVTRAKGEDYVFGGPDEAPFVARILGNAIVGNTMTTGDVEIVDGVPFGLNSGPIINLWHAQKTYIVNNTIARNTFATNNFRRLIIGRGNDNEVGDPSQLNGSLGSTQNAIEIVNNFVFDNNNAASLFDDTTLSTVGCRALVSEAENDGARFNWVFKSGGAGACNNSINNDPGNNNITNVDPYPVDENGEPTGDPTYIIGGEDPTSPGFYVLTGTPGEPDGVDDGDNTFVQTNLPTFFAGRDVRRATRVRDGDEPTDGTATIDIGAYETTPLSIVNPIDVPTAQEDSGVITFEFNSESGSLIEGGVPPFSFDITRYPKYFGTHCDARFTFARRGIVIEELDSGLIVASYCPPRDFHTQSTHPFFNIEDVSFDVDVIDATNSVVDTVANYTIDQVNDTNHNTSLSTEASVAIGRPETSPQNQVKLRPYVDFTNNFIFSESNNGTGTIATEVDYDFDYTFPTVSGNPPLEAAMVWINENAGIIGFDLQSINTEQETTFTYDVSDRRGNTRTHTIVINAVTEPGNFSLLTPQDNSIILDVEELTEFTWEFAEPVESYNFYVEREVDTDFFEPIYSLMDLPADAYCTANTCELPTTDPLLVLLSKGRYRWNVEANNQGLLKPANEPFIFNIIGGRELIKNGSFETKGKTNKLAQGWRVPANVTGDRRTGKAGAGNGADGDYWYRLTAQTTNIGNIKQNARPLGAPGDLLTLSAYVKTKGLQAKGFIKSQITYTNGRKTNIRLNIPKGNNNSWTPLAKTIQLKGIVQKNVVTIQQAKGKGRFDIDLVSLILDQQLDFKLIGPTDNATFVAAGAVDTFTWDESGSAKLYSLTITDIETTTAVVTEIDLTKKKDADRLTCNKDLCRYTLETPLPEGRYEWSVTASTGFTALNAPFRFDIDLAPTELLKNPGFENAVTGSPKLPAGWKRVKVGANDARVCNTIPPAFKKKDVIRAYQGNCAFQFKGRPNAQVRLEQKPDGSAFAVDDQLVLSFVAKTAGLKENAGRVILTITYTGGEKETLKEVLPPGKNDWDTFEKVLNVTNTVQALRLQVIHSGATGGYTIDSISVTRLGG